MTLASNGLTTRPCGKLPSINIYSTHGTETIIPKCGLQRTFQTNNINASFVGNEISRMTFILTVMLHILLFFHQVNDQVHELTSNFTFLGLFY